MVRRPGHVNGRFLPTALVTGAAGALGRELSRGLLERGYRVLATDFDYPRLEGAAADGGWRERGAETRRLDVRQPDQWEASIDALLEHWGRLDLLVHAAGVRDGRATPETRYEDLARVIDVNVKGAMLGTSLASKVMVEQGHGHIVQIASMCDLGAQPGIALYGASQEAVRAHAIAVGQELRGRSVYVTAVCPLVGFSPSDPTSFERNVSEIARAIFERALVEKPLELVVEAPFRFHEALARIGHAFPDFGAKLRRRVGRPAPSRPSPGSMRE